MLFCNCSKPSVEVGTWKGEPSVCFCAGGYEAIVIPSIGANLIELKNNHNGVDILRTPPDIKTLKENPYVYGMPVLFPPNRIENGCFEAGERMYSFRITDKANNMHSHGFLAKADFTVTRTEADKNQALVELTFVNHQGTDFFSELPHEFEFKILYILSHEGLLQKVTVVNKSSSPMPMGLGFHTTFKIPFHHDSSESDYNMKVSIGKRWELSERVLPTGVQQELDANSVEIRECGVRPTGNIIDGAHFTTKSMRYKNRDFYGVIIKDNSKKIDLVYEVGSKFSNWMLWNNTGMDGFICPEPQTCAVNAPNIKLPYDITGFMMMNPEEIWEETSRIYVEGYQD